MNRELKFRVWSNVKKDWVQNMMLLACIDGLPFAHFVELDDEKNLVKHHIYNASNLELTIQQYTGLKDKNGKEIYEGDILHSFHGEDVYVEVFFSKGNIDNDNFGSLDNRWCYRYADKGGDYLTQYYPLYAYRAHRLTVAGNIYENPKLLES